MVNWLNCIWSSDLHPTSKYMACYLRRFMNDFNDMAWPSLRRMESETGLTRPTVVKYLKNLESNGWLVKDGSKHSSMTYIAVLPKVAIEAVNQINHTDEVVKDVNQGGKGDLPQVVNDVYPNKQENKQTNKQLDFSHALNVWNGLDNDKLSSHRAFPDKAKRDLPKCFKKYQSICKAEQKEPKPFTDWVENYFDAVSDFRNCWSDNITKRTGIEYACRIDTYDKVLEWLDND